MSPNLKPEYGSPRSQVMHQEIRLKKMQNQKVVGEITFSCFSEKILPWKGDFGELREVVSTF
jgi:hypothetical protein